ncbi:hypothetical protein CHL67_05795 [Prosthecochloris sp. GSB1]|uniref:radical SAM protein n=1 Tax=Prosthecochloris sp. GSB1 TaxID=281093 RepID=UPI000B8CAFA3|nr:radical SAM protein [Prosthecochloris sp. GSB1]ASQ90498.1 hypothetical protein CHL67_05795 [Prosthecochloris sp. GSB1]
MLLLPFRTTSGFYLYTAWSNRILRTSASFFSRFSPSRNIRERISTARGAGLLPERKPVVDIYGAEFAENEIQALGRNGPDMLVLSITEKCNFRCEYCYYSGAYPDSRHHSEKRMSHEIALKAIEWYLGFEREEYRIGFYGGEPLLDFDLIRKAVDHAERFGVKRPVFALTTNGDLLTQEVCGFLARKRFETFVSLDGPAHIHDRYRKDGAGAPTYGKIMKNLKRFRREHPAYFKELVNFNMTVAPPDPLEDIAVFMQDNPGLFREKIPKLSPIRSSSDTPHPFFAGDDAENRIDYDPVWRNFLESCAEGNVPGAFERSLCEAPMARIHRRFMKEMDNFVTTGGQCVPGKRCFVDTQGVFHMCERINDRYPLGSVDRGYDFERIASYLAGYSALLGKRCADCWAVRLCRKCIPLLADGDEISESTLEIFCERQKKTLERNLVRYCETREKKDDCFDWID